MGLACHLQRQTFTDISCHADIQAGIMENVIGQHRCGRFTIGSGYTNHLGIGVPSGKLYLGDHRNPLFRYGKHNGRCRGDARTFHHLIGLENTLHRVVALLPFDPFGIEHGSITGCDRTHI